MLISHSYLLYVGCIVNVGSVVGSDGNAGQVAYSSSKAGLIGEAPVPTPHDSFYPDLVLLRLSCPFFDIFIIKALQSL